MKIGSEILNMNDVEKGVNFGYLDFSGRPTFTAKGIKGNFEKKELTITYEQNSQAILKKPFYIFAAIFSMLTLIVTVKRLNFSAFEEHSKV